MKSSSIAFFFSLTKDPGTLNFKRLIVEVKYDVLLDEKERKKRKYQAINDSIYWNFDPSLKVTCINHIHKNYILIVTRIN